MPVVGLVVLAGNPRFPGGLPRGVCPLDGLLDWLEQGFAPRTTDPRLRDARDRVSGQADSSPEGHLDRDARHNGRLPEPRRGGRPLAAVVAWAALLVLIPAVAAH